MKIFEAIGAIVGADIARDAHVTKVSAEIGDESLGAPPIQPMVVEDCVDVIDLTSLSVRARQAEKLSGKGRGSAILVPYSE